MAAVNPERRGSFTMAHTHVITAVDRYEGSADIR